MKLSTIWRLNMISQNSVKMMWYKSILWSVVLYALCTHTTRTRRMNIHRAQAIPKPPYMKLLSLWVSTNIESLGSWVVISKRAVTIVGSISSFKNSLLLNCMWLQYIKSHAHTGNVIWYACFHVCITVTLMHGVIINLTCDLDMITIIIHPCSLDLEENEILRCIYTWSQNYEML